MTGDCTLGPYEPAFRYYLLGDAAFPCEVVISVGLFEQSSDVDTRGWVSEPISKKTRIGWLHGFLMTGLVFRCWIGKTLPPGWQQVSLTGPVPNKYVSILEPNECADFLAAAEMVASAKPRGKLARFKLK
jgi:hypothetical protein